MLKRRARFWAVLAAGTLAGACAAQDLGQEYTEVSEEDSGLMFYGPGLDDGYRQFLTGSTTHFVRQTFATYGARKGGFPIASMYLVEAPSGRHFTQAKSVRNIMKDWRFFENKTIVRGAEGTALNAMGRIDYLPFTADGISCIGWLQTMGVRDEGGVGTVVLAGYYCRGKGPIMDDSEAITVVKRLGHRKYGPIRPPSGWVIRGIIVLEAVWENASSGLDRLKGELHLPRGKKDGIIRIGLDGVRSCEGPVKPVEKTAIELKMAWEVTCSDGLAAKGSLKYRNSQDYLVGEGEDSKGRNVALLD